MSKLVVPAAAALLLGAVVTELYSRLWSGQYFSLFLLTAAGIFVGAYVSTRLMLRQAAVQPAREPKRSQTRSQRQPRSRGRKPDSGAERPPQGARTDRGPAPGNGRESGQVKWFNRNKGFGFIIRDAGGEIFVHQRSITDPGRRSLRDGERVSFAVVEHDKGLQAESVSVVDD